MATAKELHGNGRNVFGANPHFQFRDQDPVFDGMRTVLRAAGYNPNDSSSLTKAAHHCYMSPSTFHAWFIYKSTHSPRHESVQIFYHAFGIPYGPAASLHALRRTARAA